MFTLLFVAVALATVAVASSASPEERAEQLLSEMTFEEKVTMMHGEHGTYVGNVRGNSRLGIPSLNLQDGPQGFRTTDRTGGPGTSTAWPSALSVAASWDTDLLYRWAEAMAAEFAAKGANIALGPGIGMARVPTAGRNFEYLCGEDPVLGSALATAVVKGIQSQGIMANAKHWVNNEIEDQRKSVSADVNERVRMELYYPPFQAAVDAGVLTVMCSYNRINDVYACQNNVTLGELREDLGFNGWVMSDWTATHATAKSVNAGLDSEMPLGLYFSQHALQNALDAGEITMEEINTSVKRILTTMFTIGLFDREPKGDPEADVTSEEHSALAREIAAKSMVLMKNSYVVLPIIKTRFVPGSCMAVIGDEYTVYGNGSGHVDAKYTVTPAQGIAAAMAGTGVDVIYNDGSDIDSAVALATKCGFAVVVVATTSGEGSDRENLSLGGNQDDLVVVVNTALNRAAVIVVNTPGAVLMPWASQVSTLIVGWLPGQEAGNALADVIFGVVNPSGRLHVTMPNKENEVGFTSSQYPGEGEPRDAVYSEELLIGYRWYNYNQVKPAFPFGHGLSYTTFVYTAFTIQNSISSGSLNNAEQMTVTFNLANSGKVDGAEVVQLYLTYPESAGEPPLQLKSFTKVYLPSGQQSTPVTMTLSPRSLAVWDESSRSWTVPKGTFVLSLGASSADIRFTSSVQVV